MPGVVQEVVQHLAEAGAVAAQPASRAGYFLYPLGLSAWLLLTRPPRTRPTEETSHERTLTPTARAPGHGPAP